MQDAMSPELVCFIFQLHGHRHIQWTKIKTFWLSALTVLKWVSDGSACRIPHQDLNKLKSIPSCPHQRGHQMANEQARLKFLWRRHQGDGFSKRLWSSYKISLKLQTYLKEINRLVWGKNFLRLHCSLIWSPFHIQ